MSRHRAAPDDDELDSSLTSDTGPLYLDPGLRVDEDVPDIPPADIDPPHDEAADEIGLLAAAPAAIAPDQGRPRRAPSRRRRRPLGIALSLGVITALVVGIFYGGRAVVGFFETEPAADYSGQGSGSVQVEVPDGASTAAIAQVLVDNGIVASAEAFLAAATANAESIGIQPGIYAMRSQMSAEAALALLLDPASKVSDRFTIPEGFTLARTLDSLTEQTGIARADFEAAAAVPDQLGLPAWANGQLEGFVYPDTYDIVPDSTALEILTAMVGRFNQVATESGLETDASAVGLTPYELLTVASLVQSEVTVESERPMVARVIYNRLAQDIALGIDAALAYELSINGGELTTEVLERDSPYNTRTRTGLPPTPISNPGAPSILGALEPAEGPWLYYVLQSSDGTHLFTESYDEFLVAKAECEAQGLGCG